MDIKQISQELAKHGKDLQFPGTPPLVSFGKGNKALSFVDEAAKAHRFSLTIKNDSADDAFIVIGGFNPNLNLTQFADASDILAKFGADAVLQDGVILAGTPGTGYTGEVSVKANDSRRTVNGFLRYAAMSPLRVTNFKMTSRSLITNAGEATNYDNLVRSHWVSPFEDTVSNDLDLRPLQVGGNNFNREMLEVDFQTQGGGFNFIVSNEHFNIIQVNKHTELSITMSIGGQLSAAQQFYRIVKKADDIMAPTRRIIER